MVPVVSTSRILHRPPSHRTALRGNHSHSRSFLHQTFIYNTTRNPQWSQRADINHLPILLIIHRINLLFRFIKIPGIIDQNINRPSRNPSPQCRTALIRRNINSSNHLIRIQRVQFRTGGSTDGNKFSSLRGEFFRKRESNSTISSRDSNALSFEVGRVVNGVDVEVATVVFGFGTGEAGWLVGDGVAVGVGRRHGEVGGGSGGRGGCHTTAEGGWFGSGGCECAGDCYSGGREEL
mmetsp:Transcript_7088/g.8200  ORF Transcript_7088/g.8200 Transcript_7088/m.8200 type:complete len:236 (-) Transcript_7088:125-832(-)